MAYVYLIYGMYWCFNAVTRERGHGSAVLVRAVSPVDGLELMRERRPRVKRDRDLTTGPGKLCLAMGIVGSMSGTSLRTGPIVIRSAPPVDDSEVVVTPRIGITRAAEWPLRYLVRDDPYVSATPASFTRTAYAP
jgi:DNA-3-methyladenine glycosylase